MADDETVLVVIYGIWRQHEPKLDIEELISRLERLVNTSCQIKKLDLDFVVEDASAVNEIVTETGFKALEKITTLVRENAASIIPTFYACIGLASVAFKSALIHASNRRQNSICVRLTNAVAGVTFLNGLHLQTEDRELPKVIRRWLVCYTEKRKYKKRYKGNCFPRLPILSCYETTVDIDTKGKRKRLSSILATKPETVQVNLASVFTTQMHRERVVLVDSSIKSLLLDKNCKFWRALNTFMEENKNILKLDTPLEGQPARAGTLYSTVSTFNDVVNHQSQQNMSPNSDAVSRMRRNYSIQPALESQTADFCIPCHYYGTRPIGNPDFCGRETVIDQIEKTFMPNDLPATFQALQQYRTKVFCITGPGGIGKTRIAAEYIAARSSAFDVIAWLDASDSAKLLNGYQDFAVQLGLLSSEEVESSDADLVISHVNGWLTKPVRNSARTDGPFMRWLIILDDVSDADEILARFWPAAADPPGCLLVTGKPEYLRSSSCFGNVGAQIEPLPNDDAVQLLLQLTNKRGELDALKSAQRILDNWDRLPISIMCVVSIIQRNGYTLAKCASLSPGVRRKFLASEWGFKGKMYNLASMWAIAAIGKEERAFLDVISLLDSSCIPDELLAGTSTTTARLPDYPSNRESYDNLKESLWRSTLIQHLPEKHAVSIHQVCQETILERLVKEPERFLQTFAFTAALLSSIWPAVVTQDMDFSNDASARRQSRNKDLFPHVIRLSRIHEELKATTGSPCLDRNWLRLLLESAWYKAEQSDFLASESILNQVIQDTNASKEQSSDFILATLDTKTRIGASLGRHEHVLEHTRERMEILEREYEQSGRATQRLCGVYCDRAMALVEIGASDEEVLKLTRKSCDLRRSLPDFDEQQLFTARRAEGMLYLHSRRLDQAEERFMKASKVRENKFGVDDKSNSRTGSLLWDLGNVYYQQGLLEESLEHFNRALKNFIATSGQQHLSVARTYYKIAICYLQQNQPESVELAVVELEKALAIYEQKPMHVAERARCLFVLHEAQIKAGRADQPSSKLMQSLTLRRTHLKNIGSQEKQVDDVISRADFDKLCSITGR